jgi:prophage DNA circulation protein
MANQYEDLASIDGIELRILDIKDNFSHALVKHEFIGLDGARIDNMGRHAREIEFKALFYGFNETNGNGLTSATYNEHFNWLTKMLDSGIQHTLIHPKYGSITGRIQTLQAVHDDTLDYVAIDVVFIEDGIITQIGADVQSLDSIITQAQLNNFDAALVAFPTYATKFGAGEINGVANLNPAQSLVSQFHNASAAARNFLNTCDSVIGTCTSFLSQITEPLNTLDTAINFVNDVPSLVLGAINGAVNRITGSLTGLYNSPAQFASNFSAQIEVLVHALTGANVDPFRASVYQIGAGTMAVIGSQQLVADNAVSQQLKNAELSPTFDDAGNYIGTPITTDTMTVNDLELMLYTIRNEVQLLIDFPFTDPDLIATARDNAYNLEIMASSLRSYVDTIKLNRLTVKTIQVNNIPLPLLATQLGLGYNAMERILKLNPSIKNPAFVSGSIQVYVQ